MEIKVNLEPIDGYSTGGGYRESSAVVTIDSTYSRRMQREAVIYEILGLYLDHAIPHDLLEDLAGNINDGIDQLEAEHERAGRTRSDGQGLPREEAIT